LHSGAMRVRFLGHNVRYGWNAVVCWVSVPLVKHAALRAVVHNVADSLASGIGLLIGHYEMDVFGEAARSPGGSLTIDLLHGHVTEGVASSSLAEAVSLYRAALARLCARAGGSVADLSQAHVRYWSDPLGPRFAVTIQDASGRCSTTEYVGVPGKRPKVMDALGRLRPKPSVS
jgi:hypothetical protein